jgi:hypothetical protein
MAEADGCRRSPESGVPKKSSCPLTLVRIVGPGWPTRQATDDPPAGPTVEEKGAGVLCSAGGTSAGTCIVTGNIFRNNTAGWGGAGLYLNNQSVGPIDNNVFVHAVTLSAGQVYNLGNLGFRVTVLRGYLPLVARVR